MLHTLFKLSLVRISQSFYTFLLVLFDVLPVTMQLDLVSTMEENVLPAPTSPDELFCNEYTFMYDIEVRYKQLNWRAKAYSSAQSHLFTSSSGLTNKCVQYLFSERNELLFFYRDIDAIIHSLRARADVIRDVLCVLPRDCEDLIQDFLGHDTRFWLYKFCVILGIQSLRLSAPDRHRYFVQTSFSSILYGYSNAWVLTSVFLPPDVHFILLDTTLEKHALRLLLSSTVSRCRQTFTRTILPFYDEYWYYVVGQVRAQ